MISTRRRAGPAVCRERRGRSTHEGPTWRTSKIPAVRRVFRDESVAAAVTVRRAPDSAISVNTPFGRAVPNPVRNRGKSNSFLRLASNTTTSYWARGRQVLEHKRRTTLKMAVFASDAEARVRIAMAAKPGCLCVRSRGSLNARRDEVSSQNPLRVSRQFCFDAVYCAEL